MRAFPLTIALVFLATYAGRSDTNAFACQVITLPVNISTSTAHFARLDQHGRSDLLAVDPVERKLLIYRQRVAGFTNTPDQILELPPQTAWIAPFDVDAHPGLELLMSTASGLVYFRQNNGRFETDPRSLIAASQIFTNDDPPVLVTLPTNAAIPVINATNCVLYRRNADYKWFAGEPAPLSASENNWYETRNEWTLGASSARRLQVRQTHWSKSPVEEAEPSEKSRGLKFQLADAEKAENDAIGKIIGDLKKVPGTWHQPGITQVDLNGDGRKDLILWQVVGEVQFRTDVYVSLRGADGKLPEHPDQVLHCRGFPIPTGSTDRVSPIADLKGDGTYELVLLELKSTVISVGSLVDMALSRGLHWSLNIRTYGHDGFSRSPDGSADITCVLPADVLGEWPLFICGDFNGDGRPDFVVQRTSTEWGIYASTNDGTWFQPKPSMSFESPVAGNFEISDLNGDGRADIVLRGFDDPRMFIFLSQTNSANPNP